MKFDTTWNNQIKLEVERYQNCNSNVRKYFSSFSDEAEDSILKDLRSTVKGLQELGSEEQQKRKSLWNELCSKSETHFSITASNAIEIYHQYRKDIISIEYKIEEHCDRFINNVNKTLTDFEEKIEAQSI